MDQHNTWLEARKRLQGGNNTIRTEKIVTIKQAERTVRIDPGAPLPKYKPPYFRKGKILETDIDRKANAIIEMVCVQHRVKKRALLGRSREHRLSQARLEAYYLLRHDLYLTSPQIGRLMGGRDHTTVLSGLAKYLKETGKPIQ